MKTNGVKSVYFYSTTHKKKKTDVHKTLFFGQI